MAHLLLKPHQNSRLLSLWPPALSASPQGPTASPGCPPQCLAQLSINSFLVPWQEDHPHLDCGTLTNAARLFPFAAVSHCWLIFSVVTTRKLRSICRSASQLVPVCRELTGVSCCAPSPRSVIQMGMGPGSVAALQSRAHHTEQSEKVTV